ncbi:MAG: phenylalanine--tRNA ligase subunit beta [Gammaproteobacteria bacterium]|nr:phenylalanine--tRNA ligase subunit beta [Gammaproteobacteria bacterium]
MKISEAWLRTWVNPPWTTEELTQKLAMLGMEVASVTPVVNDVCIDIDITPNRGDCLSIAGLAREVAAASKMKSSPVSIPSITCKTSSVFPVLNDAKEDCARYCCRVIDNLDPNRLVPLWLQERLGRGGIKSISSVVDITNYVMLELGQPLHAFDKGTLKTRLTVRYGKPHEKLVTLEGKEIALDEEALVIADEEGPVALAGVVGGMETRVTHHTHSIVLESAGFNPIRINRVVQKWGIATESSHRFERGVSSSLQWDALERATQLILEACGGEAGSILEVMGAKEVSEASVLSFRVARVQEILGVDIAPSSCRDILERLGCEVVSAEEDNWRVRIPPHRLDLTLEIDLVEEIARLYGYEAILPRLPVFSSSARGESTWVSPFHRIKQFMSDRGYSEVVTYSFCDPKVLSLLENRVEPLMLLNPISEEMSAMRTTLWAGLLHVLQENHDRQSERNRFCELGRRFIPGASNKTEEEWCLSGVVSGSRLPEQWGSPTRAVDFFDVKSDLEALFALFGKVENFQCVPGIHPALHPGQTASVLYQERPIGLLGSLHPAVQKKLGLKERVILFEIQLEWVRASGAVRFSPLSKFPTVRRDIALIVDEGIQAEAIIKTCKTILGSRLCKCVLFDVYAGEGIEKGKKSIALGFTIGEASRTLTDEEVSEIMSSLVRQLTKTHHAILRDESWQ